MSVFKRALRLKKRLGVQVRDLAYRCRSLGAKTNERPVFVLGSQKSGTTAIASLLARAAGLSVSLDLRREIDSPSFHCVKSGEITFDKFVSRNKLDFSREIIKEPNLTLFFDELCRRFPRARYVFIVRDPRDNIRSILDRLELPGDLDVPAPPALPAPPPPLPHNEFDKFKRISLAWRLVLDGTWLGLPGRNYIETLAARWNYCAGVYLDHRDSFVLSRYEDFLKDKTGEVKRIAGLLGFRAERDITAQLDVQYQTMGRNRGVDWKDFFQTNLERIEAICGEKMALLGYVGGEPPRPLAPS